MLQAILANLGSLGGVQMAACLNCLRFCPLLHIGFTYNFTIIISPVRSFSSILAPQESSQSSAASLEHLGAGGEEQQSGEEEAGGGEGGHGQGGHGVRAFLPLLLLLCPLPRGGEGGGGTQESGQSP